VRRIPWLGLVAIAMMATGIVIAFVGHDTLRWAPPPVPPAWAARDSMPARTAPAGQPPLATPPANREAGTPAVRHPGTGLPGRSSPVSLSIPEIKIHASIIALGLNPNGTLIVPPLSRPGVASWFDKGPIPGQPGAAAILGHVDASGVGPAVFYELGSLRPGAKIYVRLHDGQTVVFETYSVALYSKATFPTGKVFGFTSWPTLRLITCGGEFDRHTRHYDGNVVAFASYVGSFR
jgi:Sortase domain